jgi:hypothetical protein
VKHKEALLRKLQLVCNCVENKSVVRDVGA